MVPYSTTVIVSVSMKYKKDLIRLPIILDIQRDDTAGVERQAFHQQAGWKGPKSLRRLQS